MARKSIPSTDLASVLLKSRRRCCICFGLNRDTSIQQGQIAHLDGDSSNKSEDNLAFLCFNHHDQYDGTTRQSKNFTPLEVKRFRKELYTAIELAFNAEVLFGEARATLDAASGHYIRGGAFESAELKVQSLHDGRYHITGLALWGKSREYGQNLGEIDFIGELKGKRIVHTWTHHDGKQYEAILHFGDGRLLITEKNWVGVYGMNVNFSGKYEKAS